MFEQKKINKIYLMLSIYIGLITDPVSCIAGDLIKSFTVNGASNTIVVEGDEVFFQCNKKDGVPNLSWAIQAPYSGEYLVGNITVGYVGISRQAKCIWSGTFVCRANVGEFTDSKTVAVRVICCKCCITFWPENK